MIVHDPKDRDSSGDEGNEIEKVVPEIQLELVTEDNVQDEVEFKFQLEPDHVITDEVITDEVIRDENAKENAAATKIQAAFRAKQARKQIQDIKENIDNENESKVESKEVLVDDTPKADEAKSNVFQSKLNETLQQNREIPKDFFKEPEIVLEEL